MAIDTSVQSLKDNPALTPQAFFAFSFSLLIFGLLSSITYLWYRDGYFLFPSGRYVLFPCLLSLALGIWRIRSEQLSVKTILLAPFSPLGVAWGLLILFLSDWLCRPYNLFQGPSIRGEILLSAALCALALRHRFSGLFLLLPIAGSLIAWYCFSLESNGATLISDDHATFFYRLSHLRDQFPNIPFYHPLWNAGIDERAFFATGSLNLFLLFSPLIYLFDLPGLYNVLIGTLIFILAPSILAYVCYRISKNWLAAAMTATIALTPSLHWFKWSLKYGTLGFVTTSILLPLNVLYCCLIVFAPERFSKRDASIAFFSLTLMLFWSPSGIVFLPLILLGLLRLFPICKHLHITGLLAALLLTNGLWVYVFWDVSNVSSFITSESKTETVIQTEAKETTPETTDASVNLVERDKAFRHAAGSFDLAESMRVIRETAHSTNPLILLFGLPCICILASGFRLGFSLTACWLLVLGSLCVPLKPQLELDRMLVILQLLLCIPAGIGIAALWHYALLKSQERFTMSTCCFIIAPTVLACGFLVTGPLVSGSVIRNRSVEHYTFVNDQVTELVTFIRELPTEGRLLFSGCVTHDLNGGHLAPLSVLTDKPLIASSQVGDIWWYRDVIPPHFLKQGEAGKKKFFDLMNVSGIFAHDHKQIRYFDRHPELYEKQWSNGKFTYYTRLGYEATYFLEGAGAVLQQSDTGMTVRLDTESAVLKFRYFPFLTSSACTLSEAVQEGELSFIQLSGCPLGTPVQIHSVNPITRVFFQ